MLDGGDFFPSPGKIAQKYKELDDTPRESTTRDNSYEVPREQLLSHFHQRYLDGLVLVIQSEAPSKLAYCWAKRAIAEGSKCYSYVGNWWFRGLKMPLYKAA